MAIAIQHFCYQITSLSLKPWADKTKDVEYRRVASPIPSGPVVVSEVTGLWLLMEFSAQGVGLEDLLVTRTKNNPFGSVWMDHGAHGACCAW